MGSTHGRTTSGVACHHSPWTANMSNVLGCGMPSQPLDRTHDQIASGMTCHHRLWTTNTVERHRVWHAISPLGSTHGRTTSGVACHHSPWTANTIKRHLAWHAIISFGQHKRSNNVGRGMPSSPLCSTHGRATSGVACHHRLWAAHSVERRRAWHAIFAL